MRAGLFTDGGKRERERDAAKARRRLEAKTRGTAPGSAKPSRADDKNTADDPYEPL